MSILITLFLFAAAGIVSAAGFLFGGKLLHMGAIRAQAAWTSWRKK